MEKDKAEWSAVRNNLTRRAFLNDLILCHVAPAKDPKIRGRHAGLRSLVPQTDAEPPPPLRVHFVAVHWQRIDGRVGPSRAATVYCELQIPQLLD